MLLSWYHAWALVREVVGQLQFRRKAVLELLKMN